MNRAVRVFALASMATVACSRQQAIDAAFGDDDGGAPVDAWGDAAIDANDFDDAGMDALVLPDARVPFDTGGDAFVLPDAHVPFDTGVDAFASPDAHVPFDTGVDAFVLPDARVPFDAGVDAFASPDAHVPFDAGRDSPLLMADAFSAPVFGSLVETPFALPTQVSAAAAFRGGIVAVGSDGTGAHGRLLYLGPMQSNLDSYAVDFSASTMTTQLRAVADDTSVGTGTVGLLKRAVIARFDTAGITSLKTYAVLDRTTALEDVAPSGTELVAAGGLESNGLLAIIPGGTPLRNSLQGFEVSVDGASLTFISVAVEGNLAVAGFAGTSRGLIAIDLALGTPRWMITFPWTPRDLAFVGGSLYVVGDDGTDGWRARFDSTGTRVESQRLGGMRFRSVLVTSSGEAWASGASGTAMHVLHFTDAWEDRAFVFPNTLGLASATDGLVVVGGMPSGPPTVAFALPSCVMPTLRFPFVDAVAYSIPTTAGVHVTPVTLGEIAAATTTPSSVNVTSRCP